MPSSADAAVATIIALERSCLTADAAITERRWDDLAGALREQQALTERLAVLFEEAPEASPQRDARVMKRLHGVLTYRDDQLRRVRAYHADVAERLRSLERVRRFSRTLGSAVVPARLLDEQT